MTPTKAATEDLRKIDGVKKQALETGRNRLLVAATVISMVFAVIVGRLVDLTVLHGVGEPRLESALPQTGTATARANIVDRNGIILATSLPTTSLYADPTRVLDAVEAAERLSQILPSTTPEGLIRKLSGNGRFVWLARNLTPQETFEINRLGIPGVAFQRGERRVYPHGQLAAHVLGLTNVDGRGIAGLEKQYDQVLRVGSEPVALSIDIRMQAVLREEMLAAVREFKAIGAAGLVLDSETGEITAMVSLPDYDPNEPDGMSDDAGFNRATKGVYEMGSTFKLFTAAMALDTGTVGLADGYDARQPLRVARFTINDFHAKKRWLSVPEIILHSSNIGAAKMAVDVGTASQRDYLKKFGLLRAPDLELPEIGRPLVPSPWRPINTMTISYGHGIAVSPVQLTNAIATLVNGGIHREPTILKRIGETRPGNRVLTAETSDQIRGLMRLVVAHGTGRKADVPGYLVGGKTGTAEKQKGRGYAKSAKISSFVGAFPIDDPRFVVFVMIDEPVGNKRTFNYATGGWVAAPVVGRIVQRIAPMNGIAPNPEATIETPPITAVKETKRDNFVRQVSAFLKKASIVNRPVQQTDDEERLLLKARHAADKAVLAKRKQEPVVRTARTASERPLASN